MPYPEYLITPMREELTSIGVQELRTASAVDEAVKQPGTTMVVVNSVCGCAAGRARPGVAEALRGNLLIGSDEGRSLLRLRTDPLVPTRIIASEQLLHDQIGGIRAPVVGSDGAIYVATESAIWRLSRQASTVLPRR